MPTLGAPELIIVLLIVVVLFGASRLAGLGKSLGQGIREFRKATREDEADETGAASGAGFCPRCGSSRTPEQRFCAKCGAALESPSEETRPTA